jgi:hypothetical protein
MAYTKYSLTPANNNAAPPDGAPEGMLPSAVNDTMRDMMAQIRDVGDGIRGGTYTMTAPVITGGSISGATGSFSTLAASGVATFSAGTVSAPAITTTGDTNTGIFFPAADTIAFTEGGVESMRIDSSGNVGIGTSSFVGNEKVNITFNSSSSVTQALNTKDANASANNNAHIVLRKSDDAYFGAIGRAGTDTAMFVDGSSYLALRTGNTERMRITSAGKILINTTDTSFSGILLARSSVIADEAISAWNNTTTGDAVFVKFYTDAGSGRGSISYNRAGGLTVYNTTSDYRAKDIYGSIVNSGEVIDSVPVYMGKMKGATQARPMFIAHETPDYAHTGEKDAVDEDGNPVYQQMDASSLVPVLWAEVQSLRKRLAVLESK